jgi:proteasome accessory factor B
MSVNTRNELLLRRRWRLAQYLASARTGRTVASLVAHLEVSRATVYRDLDFLQASGAAIEVETVNGETRYRVLAPAAQVVGSPMRALALDLAIASLEPLQGTKLLDELRSVRRELAAKVATPRVALREMPHAPTDSALVATLERAVDEARELSIRYRGARDPEVKERRVWPLELQLAKGQLYVLAHDPGCDDTRTFKVARIERAKLGASFDRAALPPVPRAPSVVVWRAAPVAVVVRLSAEVARFASEYALRADQRLEAQADGSVLVQAEVAGDEEALRWALSWGRHAEVLAPRSMRAKARDELLAALAPYGPGPKRPGSEAREPGNDRVVSRMVRRPAGTIGGAITAGARRR